MDVVTELCQILAVAAEGEGPQSVTPHSSPPAQPHHPTKSRFPSSYWAKILADDNAESCGSPSPAGCKGIKSEELTAAQDPEDITLDRVDADLTELDIPATANMFPPTQPVVTHTTPDVQVTPPTPHNSQETEGGASTLPVAPSPSCLAPPPLDSTPSTLLFLTFLMPFL